MTKPSPKIIICFSDVSQKINTTFLQIIDIVDTNKIL